MVEVLSNFVLSEPEPQEDVTNIVTTRRRSIDSNSSSQIRRKVDVELRLAFVKIGQIDTINEQYQSDVFLHARWREPQLDGFDGKSVDAMIPDLWNPELFIENAYGEPRENTSREPEFEEIDGVDSGFVVERRRIKGVFLETLELKHFPFDCQDLSITVTSELPVSEVMLVESATHLSRVNTQTFVDSQEWDLLEHVEVTHKVMETDVQVGPRRRCCMTFTCRAARRFGYFILNNLLVSGLICLLSLATFAVDRTQTHGRLQLSFLLLLTTVTFKFVAGHNLPKIPYLTYLDKLLLANLGFLLLICSWHAAVSLVSPDYEWFTWFEKFIVLGMGAIYFLILATFFIVIYTDAGGRRRKMRKNDIQFRERVAARQQRKVHENSFHETKVTL